MGSHGWVQDPRGRAIAENYAENYRLGGLVELNDRKVLILANSLSAQPAARERVTVSGTTFLQPVGSSTTRKET